MEGVPVELKVATIFWAIMALLPIPVTITLPSERRISLTALSKSSFIDCVHLLMAESSFSMASNATFFMSIALLKFFPEKLNKEVYYCYIC